MDCWEYLARAVRTGLPVGTAAVVEGPPGLLGTRAVAEPGEDLSDVGSACADLAREALVDGRPRLVTVNGLRIYAEPLLPPPRLIVAGAGHVAAALSPAAQAAGFGVTVVDDRPDYASSERFPGATVICADMAETLTHVHTDAATFIVLAGRSHPLDRAALKASLRRPCAYVGMVGSRRKVEEIKRNLQAAGDLPPAAFEQLRAPIGLDLGAETPGEIAVSVVAELIAVRRGGSGTAMSQMPVKPVRSLGVPAGTLEGAAVWQALADSLSAARSCALATIISVRGSTPRSVGACMLVRAGGSIAGTIGGGKVEAQVLQAALAAIESGTPVLLRPQYNDDTDMICGGTAEIFVEPVVPRR